MAKNRELFNWRITRLLFALGVMALASGVLRLVTNPGWGYVVLGAVGVALLVLATRGAWDSEASGRNRSVLGFDARHEG